MNSADRLRTLLKSPSEWADKDPEGNYDCTLHIGDLGSDAPWPMYSYDRPSSILWNSIAGSLYRAGWSDEAIKDWLQSKGPRCALDADLGELLKQIGKYYGSHVAATEEKIGDSNGINRI